MRQAQPTQPSKQSQSPTRWEPRWHPRWARLLDDLRAVGDETHRLDDGSRGLGGPGGIPLPSPADARRAAQHGKALAGVTVAVVAAVAAAVVLWHVAASAMRAILKPDTPRVTQTQGMPAVRTPQATAAAVSLVAAPTAPPAAPTMGPASSPTAAPTVAPTGVPTVAPTTAPTSAPTAAPTAAAAAPSRPSATAAATASAPTRVHVVERGDTLFSIARRNGTTVADLVAVNSLAAPDAILPVGRRLVIPGS